MSIQVTSPSQKIKLGVGGLSDWISVNLNTEYGDLACLFQVKLVKLDPLGKSFTIERSPIFNTKGWTNPGSYGELLIKNMLTMEKPQDLTVEYMVSGKIEAYLKYAHQEVMNLAKIIEFSKKEVNWDMCFFHIHHLDTTNHKSLAKMFPESHKYSEKSAFRAEENVKIAYKIVDEMVGYLVDNVVDSDTITVLVSDHGAIPAWKIANIPYALYEAGLLHYSWNDEENCYVIDWSKTKAYPYLEPPYIWVNLKGRDPQGIVDPIDYEVVRDEIIEILTAFRDPKTGDPIIDLAMRKEDHKELGQNGERVGDVVYFLNPPYEIFDDDLFNLNPSKMSKKLMRKGAVYPAKRCFGAHAYYLPTKKYGPYSIRVPFIMSGPGVKSNVILHKQINLIDRAPTFAKLLNIPPPGQAIGKVITEVLKD